MATILLTIGVALAGALAYGRLPVSPLPQIDFATIFIQANMAGGQSRQYGDQRRERRWNAISARSPTSPK